MKITVDLIRELRDKTSASVVQCKKALEEAKGDMGKAAEVLRKQGLELAAKKGTREAREGRIEAYIHHGNKIGVLLEVNCESDFVARNEDFRTFTKDIAMQIAATSPVYIKKEDVPAEVIKAEKNKEEFYRNHCLMEQAFVKDAGISVKDYLGSTISRIGENIVVRRFIRYKVGE